MLVRTHRDVPRDHGALDRGQVRAEDMGGNREV
jgi:hypothetical protein